MSDADWMREAEEAMALRGVAAEAMRERDRLQAEVARLRGMVAEYDAELVKLRAEDAEWSELCNQQQQIIEKKFFIKDPQVCGWCWMAAGDSEESKESLQRFTIADIRKHTLTCANNPLVAERDAARAEVERMRAALDEACARGLRLADAECSSDDEDAFRRLQAALAAEAKGGEK